LRDAEGVPQERCKQLRADLAHEDTGQTAAAGQDRAFDQELTHDRPTTAPIAIVETVSNVGATGAS
jgi:hypothetical protein